MRTATLVLFLLCLGSASDGGRAQPAAAVMTDSQATCSNLSRRLPASPPDDVRRLQTRGQLMCNRGQVRGGIMELRRALLLAHGGGGKGT